MGQKIEKQFRKNQTIYRKNLATRTSINIKR